MPLDPPRAKKLLAGRLLVAGLVLIMLGVAAALIAPAFRKKPEATKPGNRPAKEAVIPPLPQDQQVYATYGKSPSCKKCHEEAYQLWEKSHHALAERPLDAVLDAAAFQSHFNPIRHGTQVSFVTNNAGRYEIHTTGLNGQRQAFVPERVLGVDPLVQYIVPKGNGVYQMTELAFAPGHPDWFNVYGEDDRKPGEWGHWTGRGMTWNSMCAACHNTRVRKNYVPIGDGYRTAMVEHGVGCESCHGPMADHNAWQEANPNKPGDPTIKKLSREQMFNVCGTCHSRRAELTGDFKPGDSYFDHHALSIPDETDLFYEDGQIRDEDFELTAFLGSRMHASGVRCIDCHEPHAGKVRISGNNLCLVCHAAENPPAPKIDIATHSHHKIGERGDSCMGCHMPQTVYMQRHARHDHGFTVPDPLMTKELGIPNACNRCHSERDADWALEYMEKWYGDRMRTPLRESIRQRTRVIAGAKRGEPGSAAALVSLLRQETNVLWRAASAGLLRRWAGEAGVTEALLRAAEDAHPLVRSYSLRSLESVMQSGNAVVRGAFEKALRDTNRNVRIDAAWALHAVVNTNTEAAKDLLNYLGHIADQPAGVLQKGVFQLHRGEVGPAIASFEHALQWDTNSAAIYHALAVGYSTQGRGAEAVQALETACRLAPRDPEFRFKLGLAYSEVNRLREAREALRAAVELDPNFAQAWYNLGLAENENGDLQQAVVALQRAETIQPHAAHIPYARATILMRMGKLQEAGFAAERALQLQPGYPEAQNLLRSLGL